MTVRIVTDSTSGIDRSMAEDLGISIIPQSVHFGANAFEDGVTITPDEFYEMLSASADLPRTSQASPGRFKDVYEELGRDADGIVSIHISSRLSGTWNSALLGASKSSSSCPIEVIDSRQASMGLGLVVLAAADAARRGADLEEVIVRARSVARRAQCMCLFETLGYLQKGGRIGRAQALMGSALKIKPMIIVRDGEVHPLGRSRTFARALSNLKEAAREFAPIESLAVSHSTTPEIAREVASDLNDMLPEGGKAYIARLGPALGVYAGPGAIEISLIQAEE
ncbi:MAG: DegV family protein [Chloroflexi bacterium]|nr:DegV family protein [Chloroflexota bacterium]